MFASPFSFRGDRGRGGSPLSAAPLSVAALAILVVSSVAAVDTAPVAPWTQVADGGPSPRLQPSMVFDTERDVAVLFGGMGATFLGDTWQWDGVDWQQVAITGPSPRSQFAMAFDEARGVAVLFGGFGDEGYRDDTWEWDGTSWTQVATEGPPARSQHAMTYDASRGRVVLFGGFSCHPCRAWEDTWEWDGVAWQEVAIAGPPARSQHAMAYDVGRATTVLFGGFDGAEFLGDTWEYRWEKGVPVWRFRTNSGPAPRSSGHGLAHDTRRGVTVLFSGVTAQYRPTDTWEWNGDVWQLGATLGPPQRSGHALVYDRARERSLLFGGFEIRRRRYGDTWEYSRPAVLDYCFHALGTFGGAHSSALSISPATVDSKPLVTGQANLPNGRHHAFVYDSNPDPPLMLDLGATYLDCPNPSQCSTSGSGINVSGRIAGTVLVPGSEGLIHHAMLYDENAVPTMKDLGTLDDTPDAESFAVFITPDGGIVGQSTVDVDGTPRPHAFYWQDDEMIDLDEGAAVNSAAFSANRLGMVVGVRANRARAWVRTRGGLWQDVVVDDSVEECPSGAWDVNEFNFIVGFASGEAMLWVRQEDQRWNARSLGTAEPGCDGLDVAYGINNATHIVGVRDVEPATGRPHAYLWVLAGDQVIETDLNDLAAIPDGWVLDEARDVNDQGWIVGSGFLDADGSGLRDGNEAIRAFVLEPTYDGSCSVQPLP